MCPDKEQLIAFLYDECTAAERPLVEGHLATCPQCAAEIEALDGTRSHLAAWTPPDAALGFRVAASAPPGAWWRQAPAWAMAAAAALVLAAGAAVANLDVRYGADGLVVRTGWSQPAESPQAVSAAAAAPSVSPADLDALEQRLRAELAASVGAMRAERTPRGATATMAPTEAAVLARVRELIAESERRRDQQLAVRLTQLFRDFDLQRQADLRRIQASFVQLEGMAGAEAARHREQLNSLIRVSQRR
jgi:hypothetical protein